jgi:hypothetical protein
MVPRKRMNSWWRWRCAQVVVLDDEDAADLAAFDAAVPAELALLARPRGGRGRHASSAGSVELRSRIGRCGAGESPV